MSAHRSTWTVRRRLRSYARLMLQYLLYPGDLASYALFGAVASRRRNIAPASLPETTRTLLVLAPHQDDELLGCGGLIIRYCQSRSIHIAYVTDGKGRSHRSADEQGRLAATREREAVQVCKTLNLPTPTFLRFADGSLSRERALTPALECLIRQVSPDVILVPCLTDAHDDHVATAMALAAATEARLSSTQVWMYQVHSQIPDCLLNRIQVLEAADLHQKKALLRVYSSQDFGRRLTMSKYLLLGRLAPQLRLPYPSASVEQFAVLPFDRFRELSRQPALTVAAAAAKSINYSPYSFRHFLKNQRLFSALAAVNSCDAE